MANSFETELTKSFKALGWWSHKLSVSASMSKTIKRFTGRAPFDFTADAPVPGTPWFLPIGIEAKSTREFSSFPFARVQKHQVEGLLEFAAIGAPAYVAINFRKPVNVCWLIHVDDFIELRETIGRKSIPKNRFDSPPFLRIERRKIDGKLAWDLTPVIEDHLGRNRCIKSDHSAASSLSGSKTPQRRRLRRAA